MTQSIGDWSKYLSKEKEKDYFQQNRLNWWVNQDNKHWINKDSDYSSLGPKGYPFCVDMPCCFASELSPVVL